MLMVNPKLLPALQLKFEFDEYIRDRSVVEQNELTKVLHMLCRMNGASWKLFRWVAVLMVINLPASLATLYFFPNVFKDAEPWVLIFLGASPGFGIFIGIPSYILEKRTAFSELKKYFTERKDMRHHLPVFSRMYFEFEPIVKKLQNSI